MVANLTDQSSTHGCQFAEWKFLPFCSNACAALNLALTATRNLNLVIITIAVGVTYAIGIAARTLWGVPV